MIYVIGLAWILLPKNVEWKTLLLRYRIPDIGPIPPEKASRGKRRKLSAGYKDGVTLSPENFRGEGS